MEDSPSVLIPKIDVSEPKHEEVPADVEKRLEKIIKPRKAGKIIGKILGHVGIFLLVFVLYNGISGFLIYKKALAVKDSAKILVQVAKEQDLAKIETGIVNTQKALKNLSSTYKLIGWEKFVPYFGPYIADGGHALSAGNAGLAAGESLLKVITPYADLLGFKGEVGSTANVLSATTSAQTTQDRIDFIVKTIPDLIPQIDVISGNIGIVQKELAQINPDRYPEKVKNISVRSQIKTVQDTVDEASTFLVNGKPFLQSAPYLLGVDSPRTYLVLFQNDKELRPTGGFMTAYAIMKVDNAKISTVTSSDIYSLDAVYKPSIKAPDPIIKYIKGPYVLSQNWRLRDMNWSPDFASAMELIVPAAEKAGVTNIDGVIAVDTQLLVNILNVTGSIGVSGYGNYSTAIEPRCNCPQVIYELESFADIEGPIIWDPLTGKIIQRPANSDNRKKIIGPLMNSILANALGQPKEKIPALIGAIFKSMTEKHVLIYMLDDASEKAVADFGLGGTVNQKYEGDYLYVNDANLGGRKSNMYATESVEQNIQIANDGTITKTVTITYQNPEKQDGWLNSVLPTWVRVYVPKGSQLVSEDGLETEAEPYEDLGKTVFAGYFQLRPEGVSKVTLKYKLPFKATKEYKLLIQKQPGTDGFLYTVNLGKHTEEFKLITDKELKIEL